MRLPFGLMYAAPTNHSSGRYGPCLGLWVRSPSKLGVKPTVQHGLCVTSATTAITPTTATANQPAATSTTQPVRTGVAVGDCASPLSICYTTTPASSNAAAAASHVFVVGFDDGCLATYDDRTAFSSCSKNGRMASGSRVTPLRVIRPHGPSAIRCLAPFTIPASCGESNSKQQQTQQEGRAMVLSGSEACRALATAVVGAENEEEEVVMVDGREDYVLAAATVVISGKAPKKVDGGGEGDVAPGSAAGSSRVAVLTGGMDGQLRLTEVSN